MYILFLYTRSSNRGSFTGIPKLLRCHCIVVVCGDGGGVVCADDGEIVVFFVFIPCVSPPQKRIMYAISLTLHNYALQYSFF